MKNPKINKFISIIKYKFDNYMSKGGFSFFFSLLTVIAFLIITLSFVKLLIAVVLEKRSYDHILNTFWLTIDQIISRSLLSDTNNTIFHQATGFINILVGMFLFSILIAIVTNFIRTKLEELKKGKSSVVESNHILILGFNSNTLKIIEKIISNRIKNKKINIAILTKTNKTDVDSLLLFVRLCS